MKHDPLVCGLDIRPSEVPNCPACLQEYQKDPARYQKERDERIRQEALKRSGKSGGGN